MKKSVYVTFLFATNLAMTMADARGFEHPGGLHSRSQIETTRKRIAAGDEPWTTAYGALLREARSNLDHEPRPVEDFNVPGRYIDFEGHRAAMATIQGDAWVAYSCAVAYQLTSGPERKAFADKAVEILNAWATTNKSRSGYNGNLSMAVTGGALVTAAELMSDYDGWEEEMRAEFKQWVRNVYLAASRHIAGRENNWGDWGTFGRIVSHHFLDDAENLDADIQIIQGRINHGIAADGSMPLETRRGWYGMRYTYYSLAPLTAAAQIAANARGVDLFRYKGENGAGLEEALDHLFKYMRSPRDWPHSNREQRGVTPPDQGPIPANLFEAMSGIYANTAYEEWVKEARPVMVFGHHYAWSMPTLLRPVPPEKSSE